MGLGRKDIDEPKADNCCQFESERLSVHWIRNTFVARIVYLCTTLSLDSLSHRNCVKYFFHPSPLKMSIIGRMLICWSHRHHSHHTLSNSMCLAGILHFLRDTNHQKKKWRMNVDDNSQIVSTHHYRRQRDSRTLTANRIELYTHTNTQNSYLKRKRISCREMSRKEISKRTLIVS